MMSELLPDCSKLVTYEVPLQLGCCLGSRYQGILLCFGKEPLRILALLNL